MKSFKTPTGAPAKGLPKGMPTKAPKGKNSMKGIALSDIPPSVRPTTMRNLGPIKGGK